MRVLYSSQEQRGLVIIFAVEEEEEVKEEAGV